MNCFTTLNLLEIACSKSHGSIVEKFGGVEVDGGNLSDKGCVDEKEVDVVIERPKSITRKLLLRLFFMDPGSGISYGTRWKDLLALVPE